MRSEKPEPNIHMLYTTTRHCFTPGALFVEGSCLVRRYGMKKREYIEDSCVTAVHCNPFMSGIKQELPQSKREETNRASES